MRKTLLIVIDNLARGGAEILLTGILRNLNEEFEIILVTLTDQCDFDSQEVVFAHRYVLNYGSKVSLFNSLTGLNKIIRKHHPDIIHAHLFYSSLIARIACFHKTPVIYSLHSELSKNVFKNKWWLILLEKLTINKNHFPLAVSSIVLVDYRKTIKYNGPAGVLHNYIDDCYFEKEIAQKKFDRKDLKLIAVGNLKESKNYDYLLGAFSNIKNYDASLTIYGRKDDQLFKKYSSKITRDQLPIKFAGTVNNLHHLYQDYDVFISSSKHEGFGLNVIEAMASGLPVLLSDIDVFHEITKDNALFFKLDNPQSLSELIKKISRGEVDLQHYRKKSLEVATHYRKNLYLDHLFSIYRKSLK